MSNEHPLVELARAAIEAFVQDGVTIEPPLELTPEMKERAGAFVSLHRHGDLRGCIGTFLPTESNVAREIIQNAISAATRDPRFSPVKPSELADLDISVDLLDEPEPVESMGELDPKRYGVIVSLGPRRGLLLPNLDGVDSVEQQVSIAKQKAWIGPHEACDIQRFEVRRFGQH